MEDISLPVVFFVFTIREEAFECVSFGAVLDWFVISFDFEGLFGSNKSYELQLRRVCNLHFILEEPTDECVGSETTLDWFLVSLAFEGRFGSNKSYE